MDSLQLLQPFFALLYTFRHLLDVTTELLEKLFCRFIYIAALVLGVLRKVACDTRDHLAVVAVELNLLLWVLNAVGRCYLQQRLCTWLVFKFQNLVRFFKLLSFVALGAWIAQMMITIDTVSRSIDFNICCQAKIARRSVINWGPIDSDSLIGKQAAC